MSGWVMAESRLCPVRIMAPSGLRRGCAVAGSWLACGCAVALSSRRILTSLPPLDSFGIYKRGENTF